MASLLAKVSSAVAACVRRVSRGTRRLLRVRRLRRDRQLVPADQGAGDGEDGEGALWRRAILMGGRCKPLDFPGAIHYDSLGRLLPAAPPPRGGRGVGALLCRSSDAVDEAVRATKKAERV